jgi:hypothetical protein
LVVKITLARFQIFEFFSLVISILRFLMFFDFGRIRDLNGPTHGHSMTLQVHVEHGNLDDTVEGAFNASASLRGSCGVQGKATVP